MPTTTYAHFRDVPESDWRWPSFSPAEIACRGTGAIKINTEAMDKLQSLRIRLGKPLIVRSGYRSPSHNRAVGGAPASKHMLGTAFDIAMSNHDPAAFAEAASLGFASFSTSLLYSRYQPHDVIRAAGEHAAAAEDAPLSEGPRFVYRDFRTDWQAGIE